MSSYILNWTETVTRVKVFTANYGHALECSINNWLEETKLPASELVDVKLSHTEHGVLSALVIYKVQKEVEVDE